MNEYAQEKASLPGIALLVVGILTMLGNLITLILRLVGSIASIMSLVSAGAGLDGWLAFAGSTGWQLVLSLIGFFAAFIIIFAGVRLRQLRSPGIIYAGAIMAALPCCVSWCCCLGLPIAIWAIVTMQDDQVKAAFSE